MSNRLLPVKREPIATPAPLWQQAAPVVVRGAALVAAGVIGEWLLRSATKKAASSTVSAVKKSRAVAKQPASEPALVAYSETVVVRRTIWRRG